MIRRKLAQFMYGRYGSYGLDGLNICLICVGFALYIVGLFLRGSVASRIVFGVQTAFYVYFIFRLLSRNIAARRKENDAFMKFFRRIKNSFKLTKNKIRDRGEYVYKKCPSCSATLRLPYAKGSHTVKCPRCGERFDVIN